MMVKKENNLLKNQNTQILIYPRRFSSINPMTFCAPDAPIDIHTRASLIHPLVRAEIGNAPRAYVSTDLPALSAQSGFTCAARAHYASRGGALLVCGGKNCACRTGLGTALLLTCHLVLYLASFSCTGFETFT